MGETVAVLRGLRGHPRERRELVPGLLWPEGRTARSPGRAWAGRPGRGASVRVRAGRLESGAAT
ncbi:MAG: hypothetical protein V8Q84_00210 [Bilophila sp.]